jgi:hypothetical protein
MGKYDQKPSVISIHGDGWRVTRPNGRKFQCETLAEAEQVADRLVLTPADVADAMEPPWITGYYRGRFDL